MCAPLYFPNFCRNHVLFLQSAHVANPEMQQQWREERLRNIIYMNLLMFSVVENIRENTFVRHSTLGFSQMRSICHKPWLSHDYPLEHLTHQFYTSFFSLKSEIRHRSQKFPCPSFISSTRHQAPGINKRLLLQMHKVTSVKQEHKLGPAVTGEGTTEARRWC